MTSIEITVFYNSLRLQAIERYISDSDKTVIDELNNTLDDLYERLVPDNERTEIEEQIIKYEAEQRKAYEAQRRFAVFRVKENGKDCCFTSDNINSFMAAARIYRSYFRNELGGEYESFASLITDKSDLTSQEYINLCDSMPNDQRIKAMIDFDLDEGTASVCESSDNAWWKYSLHDISVATYKAHKSGLGTPKRREEIFRHSLIGKEIEGCQEDTQINSMEI